MTPVGWLIRTDVGVEFFHRRPPAAANVREGDVVWEAVYDPREVAALQAEAARYRWLKQASKAQYLWARGAFGLDDAAIDAAREKR